MTGKLTVSPVPAHQRPRGDSGRGLWAAVTRTWQRILAVTRLSPAAVCAASADLGKYDYHNYADDADGVPWGTVGGGRCKRCGKTFRL